MTVNPSTIPSASTRTNVVTASCPKYLVTYSVPTISSKRIIISCYDIFAGTKKCTLSANTENHDVLTQLKFASKEGQYLIGCSGQTVYIWDLNRGVMIRKLEYGAEDLESTVLLDVATSQSHSNMLCLVQNSKNQRVIVHEYDLLTEAKKLVRKIKITSIDDVQEVPTAAIAISSSNETLVARYGNRVFCTNVQSGKRLQKIKIKSSSSDDKQDKSRTVAMFSDDNKVVGFSNGNGELVLFRLSDGECIGTVTVSVKQPKFQICHTDGQSYAVLTSINNVVSVYEILFDQKKKQGKVISNANLSMAVPTSLALLEAVLLDVTKARVMTWTHQNMQRSGGDSIIVIDQEFRRAEDKVWESGEIELQAPETDSKEIDSNPDNDSKKRKSADVRKNIVLGPGEIGGESMLLADHQQKTTKRVKKQETDDDKNDGNEEGDEDDDFDWEEDGEGDKTTIAERLERLSSQIHRDDTEEEDNGIERSTDHSSSKEVRFKAKNATSDSLQTLLHQALISNDDTKLEIALEVGDKTVIQNSIMGLASENFEHTDKKDRNSNVIVMLLSKLVTRLAKKPRRADQLSFWIRTVLVALVSSSNGKGGKTSWKMGSVEREIALRALEPLRNLLNERAENLPALLKLDGRLSLLMSNN